MADIVYDPRVDIILTDHASYQMRRRRITMEDIRLTLDLGQRSEGEVEQTLEACAEIDGRPIAVIYDELDHRFRDIFRVITVIGKRCRE